VGYKPFGPVNALTFDNGVSRTSAFDLDYRLTSLTDSGANPLQSLTFAYDAANNVSSITDGVNVGASQNFTYDSLDQLTSATGSYGSFGYTYDSAGNRLTRTAGESAVSYGYTAHSNQLASIGADGGPQMVGYTMTGHVNNIGSADANLSLSYNQ